MPGSSGHLLNPAEALKVFQDGAGLLCLLGNLEKNGGRREAVDKQEERGLCVAEEASPAHEHHLTLGGPLMNLLMAVDTAHGTALRMNTSESTQVYGR
jgi:hypothetical protein